MLYLHLKAKRGKKLNTTGWPLPCEKGFAFCHSDPNGLGPGNKVKLLPVPPCVTFLLHGVSKKNIPICISNYSFFMHYHVSFWVYFEFRNYIWVPGLLKSNPLWNTLQQLDVIDFVAVHTLFFPFKNFPFYSSPLITRVINPQDRGWIRLLCGFASCCLVRRCLRAAIAKAVPRAGGVGGSVSVLLDSTRYQHAAPYPACSSNADHSEKLDVRF